MGKAWTVSDQDYLREHCNSMSDAEIAVALGRSENSVKNKKSILGLTQKQRAWSDEDKDFILKNKDTMSDAEIAEQLGRHVESVGKMRRLLSGRKHKPWTEEEENYLSENWGHMSVPNLCKNLDRSKNAIMVRVQRLGLPPFLESGEYITLNQLMTAMTGSTHHSYQMKSWVKNRGLPVHNKRNNQCTFRVVYIEEFWKWAEGQLFKRSDESNAGYSWCIADEPLWANDYSEIHGYYEVDPDTVGQYVSGEGFFEGDVLYGEERNEYGDILSRWFGIVKFNENKSRIMVQEDLGDWYEVDDFMYDKIIGNIYDNPELLVVGGAEK